MPSSPSDAGDRRALREQNRLSWNAATRAHQSHKEGQARFLAEGGSTLFPEERSLLGAIAGLDLLHLQCNAGQDSLSLAALGARVTGVDISDRAVEEARALSLASGIPAAFERADLYDWLESTELRFDLCFSSYGFLPWLSELDVWAAGLARVLRPGGRVVLIEFHPEVWRLDEIWRPPARDPEPGEVFPEEQGVPDYVERSREGLVPWGYTEGERAFSNPERAFAFEWSPADLERALAASGFAIEERATWPYANGCLLRPDLVETPGRRFTPPEGAPDIPLMFALAARRRGATGADPARDRP